MKTRFIPTSLISVLLSAVGLTVATGVTAEEVRSNSLTGPMYMGGGPAPGDAVADRVVVTRRVQFAAYGREGYLKPLAAEHLAKTDGGMLNDSIPDAALSPVKERLAVEGKLPRDRFGRE